MGLILFISIIFLVVGILRPKSQLLTIAIFFLMWLLMGWNTKNADFEMYRIRFDTFYLLTDLASTGIRDPGFSIIILLFKSFGINYIQFRIVISLISLLLIYGTIKRFSIYPALVSIVYFIFIFALDVTQFRNFVAYSVVIYASRFLFQKGKSGILLFVIFTLLASSIHSACLFYLLFIIALYDIKFKNIVIALIILIPLKTLFIERYSTFFQTDKLYEYSQKISIIALIFFIVIQIMNAFYINSFKKFPINNNNGNNLSYNNNTIISNNIHFFSNLNIIPTFNLLLIFLIPFYADDIIYSRIFRNIVILNFIYISNHNLSNIFKSKTINITLLFIYGIYFFIFYSFQDGFDVVIKPILIYNSIFN